MPLRCSNPDAIRKLRQALDEARYTGATLQTHIDWEKLAPFAFGVGPMLLWRLREQPRLHSLCALFLLQMPVDEQAAATAVAPASLDAMLECGMFGREGSSIRANFRLVPVGDFYVISDLSVDLAAMRNDFVMGPSISSSNLSNTTIRKPVARTLDLCCGSGIQAFAAAAHSNEVTGLDKNERALKVAEFTAILNGMPNTFFRESDFFSAAEGETFDLIVANPPYVISPNNAFQFCDGGMGADRVSEHVVSNAGRFLNEGGYCHVQCDWANVKGKPSEEKLRQWTAQTGCDMLVLRADSSSMDEYPLLWNLNPGSKDMVAFQQRYQPWIDHYEREGIESMTYGHIILRKRGGVENWFHVSDQFKRFPKITGAAVESLFGAVDFLKANTTMEALLEQRLVLNPDVRFDQRMQPDAETWAVYECVLSMVDDRVPPVSADPYIGGLCSKMNGERQLGALLVEMAAALRTQPEALAQRYLPVIRRLIEGGFLGWQ